VIFKFLSTKTRVCIWLFEQTSTRIEGRILGFDEYMNLVVDEAEEVEVVPKGSSKKGSRKLLGRILLKGDNVTAISAKQQAASAAAPNASGAGGS
jgi:small nuclear ribonucleoprotein E